MKFNFKAPLNVFTFIASTLFVLIALNSCEPPITSTVKQAPINNSINYPYRFIDSKRETRANDGSYNEMSLYTCGAKPNIDTLKMFCKAKKDSISDGIFHIITFFINQKHARFTQYPITSMYGIDENPAKYIKADYTFNLNNGYSKLTVYEKNSWESKPIQYEIN